MEVIIAPSAGEASAEAARIVAALVRAKPSAVLGLATGSTPLRFYAELTEMHARHGLDFSAVTTFNLDEYVGLAPEHPQSYACYMREHFFSRVNIMPERIHIPNGLAPDLPGHCGAYEAAIREADLSERFARSSGPGGQNVNKVSTAVTLVHGPTGVAVTVQDSRSQSWNRRLARERLLDELEKRRGATKKMRGRVEG